MRSLNPEWREEFYLPPIESLEQSVLVVVKDDSHSGSSNDEVIGICVIPLFDLLDQQLHRLWVKLHPPSGENNKR